MDNKKISNVKEPLKKVRGIKKFFNLLKVDSIYFIITLFVSIILAWITFYLYINQITSLFNAYLFYILSFLTIHLWMMYYKKYSHNKSLWLDRPSIIYHVFEYIYMRILWVFAILGLVAFFFVYNNDIMPAEIASYKLENKVTGKEIYFQWMVHVAKDKFYNTINERVNTYSNSGYVLFYEGVQMDNESDMEALQKKMWIAPTPDLYENIWKILGSDIRSQDNNELIMASQKAINADVKVSDMLATEEATGGLVLTVVKDSGESNVVWKEFFDRKKEIVTNISEEKNKIQTWSTYSKPLTEKEKLQKQVNEIVEKDIGNLVNTDNQTVAYMLRWLFNFILKNEYIQNLALEQQWNDNSTFFQDKVLALRNKKLAESVLKSKDKKIFITYGAMHFKWFFEILNSLSIEQNQWMYEIVKVEKIRAF